MDEINEVQVEETPDLEAVLAVIPEKWLVKKAVFLNECAI